jgi:single-strand DNA-binding protein
MSSVNKCILIGRLGADPEVKHLEGDNMVTNVNMATSESYKDRNGNKVEQTEWHSLEIWGQQAKIAEQYLKKGSQLYVEGKIKTESWEDKEGNKRYRTKIRVTSFTMLGSKQEPSNAEPQQSQHNAMAMPQQSNIPDLAMDMREDELPF